MTEVKTVSQMVEPRRSGTMMFLLAVLVLMAAAGLSVFLNMQKAAITEEQDRIRVEVSGLNNEIMALQAQNVEGARVAQDWIAKIKADEIRWSSVIEAIWGLLPTDDTTGEPLVKILSYSGSTGGKLNLNVETTGERFDTFANVARLIAAFNTTTRFSGAFVPSIARGEDDQGNVLLSFTLGVTYLGEQAESLSSLTGGNTSEVGPVFSDMGGSGEGGVSRIAQ